MNVALAAAFAAIVVVTIRPSGGEHELRLRPFEDILLALPPPVHRGWIAEVIGNVLLFAPFGVVLCLRGFTIRRTVGVALALSISIELVQLLLPGRTTAIDDVICNTSGAALGWFSVARLLHGRHHVLGSLTMTFGRPTVELSRRLFERSICCPCANRARSSLSSAAR